MFVVKGAIIFPAAAALAWSVLAYACIDFGFLQRVFPVTELAERVYRASAEAVLGATLLVFLFAYLNLARWHVRYSHVAFFWLAFLAGLVGLAVFDPPVAAGVARISIAAVAGIGLLLILYLAVHNGYDRAILLVPTWLLLVVWVAAAGFAVTGQIGSDLVQPALIGGLVLIVMLIGFTVLQHAFAGGGLSHALVSDTERRALALTGAGDVVFDWDVPADRVFVGPEIEGQLGLRPRHPGGAGDQLARRAPPVRRGALLGGPRHGDRGAARPHRPRFPPALGGRHVLLVPAEGAAGDRRRRRGDPGGRHHRGRHRGQDRRGAPAPRRRARQPHRPAEPRVVRRPPRCRLWPSPARTSASSPP